MTRTAAVLNADPEVVIDWFDDFDGPNPYGFLSNFYAAEVVYEGVTFPTAEHAFAWAKVDPDGGPEADGWGTEIAHADGPGHAKSLGRRCPLRPDWEEVKLEVMREIVAAKFAPASDLAARLIATGSAYLQEGTWWHDRCWGVDLGSSDVWHEREGRNWLGMVLMERRAFLRSMAVRRG